MNDIVISFFTNYYEFLFISIYLNTERYLDQLQSAATEDAGRHDWCKKFVI